MFSIVIFSKNYASSKWCLDELVKIVECKETRGHHLMLVFYKVEPSEIRDQSGKTGEHLGMLGEKFGEDSTRLRRWRTALEDSADLGGLTFKEGYVIRT